MAKISRNQPCPCGSGKKYKQCCFKSSKLPVHTKHKQDGADGLMEEGYLLLRESKVREACDVWLELWEALKIRFKPEFKSVAEAETVCSGVDYLINWCQEFEGQLGNAGLADAAYYQKRIVYCNEFCSLFPESDDLIMHNMKRAAAESYFSLGNSDEGTKCFKELIAQYPRNIWGYIGWGDMYCLPMSKDREPDREKAEQIYKMALGKGMKEEDVLMERLESLGKI